MPRIRNWKELNFYRPSKGTAYVHIDALFGEPGSNVIDWEIIEAHFKDLMRVAISVREGRLSSTLLLRRLRSGSRRNAHYTGSPAGPAAGGRSGRTCGPGCALATPWW